MKLLCIFQPRAQHFLWKSHLCFLRFNRSGPLLLSQKREILNFARDTKCWWGLWKYISNTLWGGALSDAQGRWTSVCIVCIWVSHVRGGGVGLSPKRAQSASCWLCGRFLDFPTWIVKFIQEDVWQLPLFLFCVKCLANFPKAFMVWERSSPFPSKASQVSLSLFWVKWSSNIHYQLFFVRSQTKSHYREKMNQAKGPKPRHSWLKP